MSLKIFDHPGDTPIQFIDSFIGDIKLFIKREDLIHPQVSGNKWRKLKYNLRAAKDSGHEKIITFGGAFSNHIHATAAAGKLCGFETIGIIRGELVKPLNPTLKQAKEWGMKLVPISRTDYRKKSEPAFLAALQEQFGPAYLLPEGGTNTLAVVGCKEMVEVEKHFDFWCISCGTGGTMAGLLAGLGPDETVLGFPALKGGQFLENDITTLLEKSNVTAKSDWQLVTDYHFGGYAKISDELVEFMTRFRDRYSIVLDPIYSGKMLFGVTDLMKKGFFPSNSSILAIHTGGMQGLAGIEKKYGIELK